MVVASCATIAQPASRRNQHDAVRRPTKTWNAALSRIAGQNLPKAHLAERNTSSHALAASAQGLVGCSLSRVRIRPDGSDDALARQAVHQVAHPPKAS